jgi:hypothetical protein
VEHDRADGIILRHAPHQTISKIMSDRDRIALGDLKPLDMPAHQSLRSDLMRLSDEELLAAVERPRRGDGVIINTRTGLVYDGNGRVYELLRRAARAGSAISLSTPIPVEYYTPNYSMFPDMDLPGT